MAGQIASTPLDRTRPLWELWVVEGLKHGRIGVVAKVHHSAIDGVSGAELMVHLFDLEPGAMADPPPPEREPERDPDRPRAARPRRGVAGAGATSGSSRCIGSTLQSVGRVVPATPRPRSTTSARSRSPRPARRGTRPSARTAQVGLRPGVPRRREGASRTASASR